MQETGSHLNVMVQVILHPGNRIPLVCVFHPVVPDESPGTKVRFPVRIFIQHQLQGIRNATVIGGVAGVQAVDVIMRVKIPVTAAYDILVNSIVPLDLQVVDQGARFSGPFPPSAESRFARRIGYLLGFPEPVSMG